MTPYLIAVDEVFPPNEFRMLREYAWATEYQDKEGPDGVTYKNIGVKVPEPTKEQLTLALTWIMGYRVVLKICAFRLSLEGTEPPQWAHSDAEVARWASFVYINPGPGGTVLLRHRVTGMTMHPVNQEELDTLTEDCSKLPMWDIIGSIPCEPNRLVVIPSHQIHAAMPVYGFGQSPKDGRLILWSFFD
jgi:hypothetical protein